MGGAASLLKKKDKEGDNPEQENAGDADDEAENKDSNAKPSAFSKGFATLKKRATTATNKALAKVGLTYDEGDEPPSEEEEETTQKANAISRTGSGEVCRHAIGL
jgi:hypothetical protein